MVVDHCVAQAGCARPVCVVARDDDASLNGVIEELHTRRAPVIRFDLANFPGRITLAAQLADGRIVGTLEADGRRVRLEDIGAILWWHPSSPQVSPEGLDKHHAEWLSREAAAGLAGTLAALDCLHVNHPNFTDAAQNKPYALVQAAAARLRVPPTWIGNDGADARRAVDLFGPAVCKSLVTPVIEAADGPQVLFTTSVEPGDLDESVAAAVHQFQQRINALYEVRLIMVHGLPFAARLTAPGHSTDFRAHYDELAYDYITVPNGVRYGAVRLMNCLHLEYAALDLLVDSHARWWLVDVNPAGQWGFVEGHLPELAVSARLADVLADPRIRPRRSPHLPKRARSYC
ncbi:MvdC/MvdD family ATP grasp protein [Streptomyces sp. NPDC026294]|uniref:MvdC/MvdD family ATP grasp protein n=1 Tax=Streptomyces sp. NPDC026294 TaxID=3155362 RepID=UPI0033C94F42